MQNPHAPKYQKSPRGRYITHKHNAQRRKVPWEFTFETWWDMWEKSGKWELRGRGEGKYCMARKGDIGPYNPGNVEIKLSVDNSKEAAMGVMADNEKVVALYDKSMRDKKSKLEPTPWPERKSAWDYTWREENWEKFRKSLKKT